MIFFNNDIKMKNCNGIYDFTSEIPEYNKITIPISYEKNDRQTVCVGMDSPDKYFDTAYFPVRLKCFCESGKKYFYITGYISMKMIFLPYESLEVVNKYIMPLIDLNPLDKNEYGDNEKSKLAMYGYNVRKGELTRTERRKILDFVIDNEFMNRFDVINLLESNIRHRGNGYSKALWNDDIEYINGKYIEE